MNDKEWIYIKNSDNSCRYALGVKGTRTLFCIGINPSTAEPNKLDRTLKQVEAISKNNGYDSWIMFNVYPKRDTHFDDLNQQIDIEEHFRNINAIETILSDYENIDIWIAFGNHIYHRDYLFSCFKDIFAITKNKKPTWLTTGLNKTGAPKHPLYQKKTSKLFCFDMEKYIKSLK